jgi:hypothetical protein
MTAGRPTRTAVRVSALAATAGLAAGVGLGATTARAGCRPAPPSPGRLTTSPSSSAAGVVDVPVIPRPDGALLINVPHSRLDRAAVRTQQDANDLWRILYGTPYPTGRPKP